MLLERIRWFWIAGLVRKNRGELFLIIILISLVMTGCSDGFVMTYVSRNIQRLQRWWTEVI